MKKNGAEIVHLATGLVVGYPPCPRIRHFKQFIEKYYGLGVVIGTHPIPLKYFQAHEQLSFWKSTAMDKIARNLMKEKKEKFSAFLSLINTVKL